MLCSLDQSPCGTYTLSQGIWGGGGGGGECRRLFIIYKLGLHFAWDARVQNN